MSLEQNKSSTNHISVRIQHSCMSVLLCVKRKMRVRYFNTVTRRVRRVSGRCGRVKKRGSYRGGWWKCEMEVLGRPLYDMFFCLGHLSVFSFLIIWSLLRTLSFSFSLAGKIGIQVSNRSPSLRLVYWVDQWLGF